MNQGALETWAAGLLLKSFFFVVGDATAWTIQPALIDLWFAAPPT